MCKRQIPQATRGRPRRYCSNPCRQVAYRQRKTGARQRRLVTLVQADGRQWLPTLPDASVDLIVTDPPYRFERGSEYFRDWFPELADEERPAIFEQFHRVLATNRHCYVFCDRRTRLIFDQVAVAAGFRVCHALIWDKQSVGLGGGCWRSQYEYIAWYERGHRVGVRKDRPNILRARRVTRRYATEKPVALLRELIAQSSHPTELVLDPVCGSGAPGHAARSLGRRALLADVDTAVARRRLRLTTQERGPAQA